MKTWLFISLLITGPAVCCQTIDSIWQNSLKAFNRQNYHGSIAGLDTVLMAVPTFGDAYYNRAIAKINLGNLEDACIDLELAQKNNTKIDRSFMEFRCNPDYIRDIMIRDAYKKEPVYPENGYRPRYTHADTLRGALRPERTCFDVTFYDLNVRINPRAKKITGSNTVYFEVKESSRTIQLDLFARYTISSIQWNNTPLVWRRAYNAIFIDFPAMLVPGNHEKITVSYYGKPPVAENPPWEGGFVWEKDKNKNYWTGVACEHLGASSWWPVKDHFSDKPDSMQISIEIPEGYSAVSNGDLKKTEAAPGRYNRFSWLVEYPINNYNATFYAGKYVSFSDTLIDGADTLRLDYNVLAYNREIAEKHFKQTHEVMAFYNKAFGYYPFAKDGFGLVESSYEGMEHQSAIAYGNGYNANNDNQYRSNLYDYIIVHEAAHEWWGNSVTAFDMADIWIHEGFATYAEYMFLEDRLGKEEYLYELADRSRYIFNVWPMVQHRDVNENTFASNDVYNKGAMMLHCLRCILNNDSLFFGLIHDFCTGHKYQVVTTQDFIDFANDYTRTDHTAFFRKFLYDTRIPLLEYTYFMDGNDLVIRHRWTEVDEGFTMPFGIGTSNNTSLRIVAGTHWKETLIPSASWFNFYNLWRGYEGVADNAFTYYHTRHVPLANQF